MILAIDATNKSASVAIYEQRLLANFTINNGYTHSESLLPLIDSALNSVGKNIKDIDRIITSNGPGSFTGIRIALSTVKALAHANACELYTVSSLESLAYHGKNFNGCVCPILDARRQSVYTALFLNSEQMLADSQLKIDQLLAEIKTIAKDRATLFVGDGVEKYREIIKTDLAEKAYFAKLEQFDNTAVGLIDCYLAGKVEFARYDNLEVNYLRLAQAERERLAREN